MALERATAVFRDKGFAGTTLDELGEAMGMNRPSIHAAFGDKSALFKKALQRYEADGEAGLRAALDPDLPLRPALIHLFAMMAERFASADGRAGGCLLFAVAATETRTPVVRDIVSGASFSLERAFAARFSLALDRGEITGTLEAAELAVLAVGLVHSLSTRTRTGETAENLAKVRDVFVRTICGPGG